MSKEGLNLNHSSKMGQITRVKTQKIEPRKTVGITLPPSLIEEARKRNLNISRICEQALQSIIEYMEAQKITAPEKEALSSFGEAFLQRKGSVPRAGFEPAT
ncbi:MAG: type II toxin-antitoxin system CcdA family antitoxin, partial [Candidatus Bathyarchaeales archaeon]